MVVESIEKSQARIVRFGQFMAQGACRAAQPPPAAAYEPEAEAMPERTAEGEERVTPPPAGQQGEK